MRQVYELMGTVASLDIPGCDDEAVFKTAFARLDAIDARFSTYKPDSELSRYQRGELADKQTSAKFKEVKAACDQFEKLTGGYFSTYFLAPSAPHLDAAQGSSKERASRTPDTVSERQSVTDAAMRQEPASAAGSAGRQGKAVHDRWYDPTGYVKGWAIAEAAKVIKKAGYKTFCLGIGGDILAASDSDKVWGIGIQDPYDRNKIIKQIEIKNGAVATSGRYERGSHIIDPAAGQPADYWASVTVTGADIITADVLATACFAAGKKAANIIANFKTYKLLAIR